MQIEFSDDDLSSDDTGDISEELDIPGEMEIEFDGIGRVVMADTDINAEGTLLSEIGELVLEADINGETHIDIENVAIEECDLDKSENQKIRDFMDTGCGCTVNKGKPCKLTIVLCVTTVSSLITILST